jgi:hypothetical protein
MLFRNRFTDCLTLVLFTSVLLFSGFNARAHGPFDHSARLIVQENQIELNVILGIEAARSLLKDHPDALLQRGPGSQFPLPPEVADRIGELVDGENALNPRSIHIHADAIEAGISILFERPNSARLEFRPKYLSLLSKLQPGVLEVTDENGNRLGAGVISSGGDPISVSLPGTVAGTEVATRETSTLVENSAEASVHRDAEGVPNHKTAESSFGNGLFVTGVVLIGAGILLMVGRSKRNSR